MMTLSEIYRAAAEQVRDGWCQKHLFRDNKVCAYGALLTIAAADGSPFDFPLIATIAAQRLNLPDAGRLPILALIDWNDAPGQTAENVAQGFELVALLWEQEQAQRTERVQETELSRS